MGTATVAKKTTIKASPAHDPDEVVILSIKCRREWRDWANKLAKTERAPLATLIDQLLAERAATKGMEEPPTRGKD